MLCALLHILQFISSHTEACQVLAFNVQPCSHRLSSCYGLCTLAVPPQVMPLQLACQLLIKMAIKVAE